MGYFMQYAYGTTILHKKQDLLQMDKLSLINDVDTRWNSYDMLERLPGLEVIKLFSCSAQLRLKFILLINDKMLTIVGILSFISRIN